MKKFFKLFAAIALSLGILSGVPIASSSQNVAYAKVAAVHVTSSHLSVKRGQYASVTVRGQGRSRGYITIVYHSGSSKAQHLGNKVSDSKGYITWRWKVGTRTTKGTYNVTITLAGKSVIAHLYVH